MANPRNSSLTNIAEENLFLDILNDAPLAANRKPTKIYGSIFYCFLLAGYATVGIAAPWIFQALQPWISQLLCSCNVILLIITATWALTREYCDLLLHIWPNRYGLQGSSIAAMRQTTSASGIKHLQSFQKTELLNKMSGYLGNGKYRSRIL